jgi:pyruvate,water dikinase
VVELLRDSRVSHSEIQHRANFSAAARPTPAGSSSPPAAAGLLVERGSLLSHSAIVSRELRLPCIVSLPGITTTLKTGDLLEMDGAAGTVRIIES